MESNDFVLYIKGSEIFSPDPLGRRDMLFGGERILQIGDCGGAARALGAEEFDASGTIALPGYIDTHVHLLGGGGEGGFRTRTPEATLTSLTTAGVTSVVGVLGTDGVTRSSSSLVAKIRALEEEGISAWGLAGYYRIPFDTLTGSVQGDIILIDKFLGVGEVALSDHRSSQPTFDEFARLAADTRVGAMLSGKIGIVQCHMGDGRRMLDLIERVLRETEIPMKHFVPTHMNRNPDLFKEGVRYAKNGGYVDYTTSTTQFFLDDGEVKCSVALKTLLDEGVPAGRVTFSSDGQGSLPEFDAEGRMNGLKVGTSSSLWPEVRDAVKSEGVALETAIRVITSNPADIYGLRRKGRLVTGNDADVVFVDRDTLEIRHVAARGRLMVRDGEPVARGTFE